MERMIGVLEGMERMEKVEVLLNRERGSKWEISLRLLSWGEGVGWYRQKTIRLDSRQLRALQTLLKKVDALLSAGRGKRDEDQREDTPLPSDRIGVERGFQ